MMAATPDARMPSWVSQAALPGEIPIHHRAVFLDRDGVLNHSRVIDGKPVAPWRLEDFHIYPEAAPALDRLRAAGFRLVVTTNQPDAALGRMSRDAVTAMHAVLTDRLPIDRVEVCFHRPQDGCTCRKPKPGMLERAAHALDIDLATSFMVGDRWSDIDAGQAVGCFSVFVDRGYAERGPERPDAVVSSLTEAVEIILGQT